MRPTSFSLLALLTCSPAGCGDPTAAGGTDAAAADVTIPGTDAEVDAPPPPADAGIDAPPADAGVDAPPPVDTGPPPSDEFVALYETVILRHCGGESCHGPGTNESTYFGGYRPVLQMPDPTTARAVLVDRPFECRSSPDTRIRVVPFDPDASGILDVTEDGICGSRHYLVLSPEFGADELGMIESWIASGAR